MKTPILLLTLALAAAGPVHAELFRPEVVRGAAIGGVMGAIIGHNEGRHGWEGAAYGAAAGALIGGIISEAGESRLHRPPSRAYRRDRYDGRRGPSVYRPLIRRPLVPVIRIDSGYSHRRRHLGAFWEPTIRRRGLLVAPHRPVHRERHDRHHDIRDRVGPRAPRGIHPPAAPAAPVTIIHHHYYGTAPARPMAGANGLFGR